MLREAVRFVRCLLFRLRGASVSMDYTLAWPDGGVAPDDVLALLRDIGPLEAVMGGSGETTDAYRWLAVTEGEALLITAGGQQLRLASGACAVFRPGVHPRLSATGGAAGYALSFELLRIDGQTDETRLFRRDDAFFGESGPLALPSWCAQTMRELLDDKPRLETLRAIRTAPAFQQLFRWLCEAARDGAQLQPEQAIERTLSYIERNYDKPVTRRQLAGLACMSPGHYSTLFKKRTGQSPLEYLHQVRIAEAKKRLETSPAPLKSIAQSVGYSDEFYFSRKFKQLTGSPPVAFAKRRAAGGRRLASLSYAYTGHLAVLEAAPVAFLEHAAERRDCPGALAIRTPGDEGWAPAMELVAGLAPELILADDQMLDRAAMEGWDRIAPLRVLPWMAMDWRGHLRYIAQLLDKEARAEAWLAEYDRKAERAAEKLRRVVKDETVAVVRVHRQQCVVYGGRNIASVLYDDLKLRQAPALAGIRHTRRLLAPEDWQLCDADRILLMIDPDPLSRKAGEHVTASRAWKRLKAVRDGRAHPIRRSRWLEYSAASHERILDEAVRLFAHDES